MRYFAAVMLPDNPESNPVGLRRLSPSGYTAWYLDRDGEWQESNSVLIELRGGPSERTYVEISPRKAQDIVDLWRAGKEDKNE